MGVEIERVVDGTDILLGEGPHWDETTQNLYFVDIFGKSIHKYNPITKKSTCAKIGDDGISFIIPIDGSPNKFVIGLGKKVVEISWDGTSDKFEVIKTLGEADLEAGKATNVLNDAKCDNFGKLWTGTMGSAQEGNVLEAKGSLFSIEGLNNLKTHVTNLTIANGLAWSPDNKYMYYIDSITRTVDQFDFSVSGITNRKAIFSFEKLNIPGLPDGMCIDSDGNLWVAVFNGGRVIKIDPKKPDTLLDTILLPATQITSVAFGGKNLDELYVTSGRISVSGKTAPSPPENGGTFKVTGLRVKGMRGVSFKLL